MTWRLSGSRRTRYVVGCALVIIAAAAARAQVSAPSPAAPHVVLYAAVGADLTWYDVNAGDATLAKRGSVTLPANVQEAWAHPSKRYLYVSWTNGGPSYDFFGGGPTATEHGVSAFTIDPASGALHPLGQPLAVRSRPIYITTDGPGQHLLVAYNVPSGVSVHRIEADGTLGSEVSQSPLLDVGVYGHQIRVDPSNRTAVLVTRGNPPSAAKPGGDPGAVKVFAYKDGVLTNHGSIAPPGFNPRDLDFHPSKPWAYVTVALQNRLSVYALDPDATPDGQALFTLSTLDTPGNIPGQILGNVRMHPNGRYLYLANRASGRVDFKGTQVFAGGENAMAVYDVNQQTGEPVLAQRVDTRGNHPRTFALDADARILVAANQHAMPVRDGERIVIVPASLAMFRIGADGRLAFVRKYDVETGDGRLLFWAGLVSLPRRP